MIRRPPRSTLSASSAASDVYKRQHTHTHTHHNTTQHTHNTTHTQHNTTQHTHTSRAEERQIIAMLAKGKQNVHRVTLSARFVTTYRGHHVRGSPRSGVTKRAASNPFGTICHFVPGSPRSRVTKRAATGLFNKNSQDLTSELFSFSFFSFFFLTSPTHWVK